MTRVDKADKNILMIRISGISFASVTSELRTGVSILSLCLAYSPETLLVRLLASAYGTGGLGGLQPPLSEKKIVLFGQN